MNPNPRRSLKYKKGDVVDTVTSTCDRDRSQLMSMCIIIIIIIIIIKFFLVWMDALPFCHLPC